MRDLWCDTSVQFNQGLHHGVVFVNLEHTLGDWRLDESCQCCHDNNTSRCPKEGVLVEFLSYSRIPVEGWCPHKVTVGVGGQLEWERGWRSSWLAPPPNSIRGHLPLCFLLHVHLSAESTVFISGSTGYRLSLEIWNSPKFSLAVCHCRWHVRTYLCVSSYKGPLYLGSLPPHSFFSV
jgi:hypothetical protein